MKDIITHLTADERRELKELCERADQAEKDVPTGGPEFIQKNLEAKRLRTGVEWHSRTALPRALAQIDDLEARLKLAEGALDAIATGRVYIDKERGKTPKTRARHALAKILGEG